MPFDKLSNLHRHLHAFRLHWGERLRCRNFQYSVASTLQNFSSPLRSSVPGSAWSITGTSLLGSLNSRMPPLQSHKTYINVTCEKRICVFPVLLLTLLLLLAILIPRAFLCFSNLNLHQSTNPP